MAHLHLQEYLMYRCRDDISHAQASFHQVCLTRDISVCCHFTLGFLVNLAKSALVPSQVMLYLGAMIDTARVFFPPLPGCRQSSMQPMNSSVSPRCQLDAAVT